MGTLPGLFHVSYIVSERRCLISFQLIVNCECVLPELGILTTPASGHIECLDDTEQLDVLRTLMINGNTSLENIFQF